MKKLLYYFLGILTFSISTQGFGQHMGYNRNEIIKLSLDQDVIELFSGDMEFDLRITVSNKSDHSFLLYGFKIIDPGYSDAKDFMKPKRAVGNALFVSNNKTKLSIPKLQGPLEEASSFKRLDSAKFVKKSLELNGRFIDDNKILLRKKNVWTGTLRVPLNLNELVKGEYEMFLIYYCGIYISNLIEEKKIHSDEIINEAVLFQGYAKSNVIKLVIH